MKPEMVKIIILLGGHGKNHGPQTRGENGCFFFIDFFLLLRESAAASAHCFWLPTCGWLWSGTPTSLDGLV